MAAIYAEANATIRNFETQSLPFAIEAPVKALLPFVIPYGAPAVKQLFSDAMALVHGDELEPIETPTKRIDLSGNVDPLSGQKDRTAKAYRDALLTSWGLIIDQLLTDIALLTPETPVKDEGAKRQALYDALMDESWYKIQWDRYSVDALADIEMDAYREAVQYTGATISGVVADVVGGSDDYYGAIFDTRLIDKRVHAWAGGVEDKLLEFGLTTFSGIDTIFQLWVDKPGGTVGDLREALTGYYGLSRSRALMIAETETTRIYAGATLDAHRQLESYFDDYVVIDDIWHTVNDTFVCALCEAKHLKKRDDWETESDPPEHPNCRCFVSGEVRVLSADEVAAIHEARRTEKLAQEAAASRLANWDDVQKRHGKELDMVQEAVSGIIQQYSANEAELEQLSQEFIKITENVHRLLTQYKRFGFEPDGPRDNAPPEVTRIDDRIAELRAQRDRLTDRDGELREFQLNVKRTIWQAVGGSEPATGVIDANTTPGYQRAGRRKERLEAANDFYESIMAGDQWEPVSIGFRVHRGRAYAVNDDNTVHLAAHNTAEVYIHEMGHIIETQAGNGQLLRLATNFYAGRTAGENDQMLRYLTGLPYGNDEVARPDQFRSPYVGKAYRDRDGVIEATEVVSMGFEYMYQNPQRFFNEDRDHFMLIASVARGMAWR